MIREKYTYNSKETEHLGFQVGLLLQKGMVLLLEGDLAAGKTTFTKGIGKALGISRTINSPTFTILKRYVHDENKLYHIDLYRLDDEGSDFDLEDYINSDGVSVIEWPFKLESLLPSSYLLIKIETLGENERKFSFEAKGLIYEGVVKYL
ncbi:MAG TPA: tRNA (adenosine(37)-N6)-threonylcarbamoyltransferase complex ATPase subunit type 1 TsaE [Acholeplasmataceae bacterium]|nr:tRNA (adenosine(37)-N6)-threonylcarbamoyltransferase complex ATPase subunit type 1 TsaE [Acholeplasmataceae bacterium]